MRKVADLGCQAYAYDTSATENHQHRCYLYPGAGAKSIATTDTEVGKLARAAVHGHTGYGSHDFHVHQDSAGNLVKEGQTATDGAEATMKLVKSDGTDQTSDWTQPSITGGTGDTDSTYKCTNKFR